MPQTELFDTIVIGGGQAGLATSYCLTERDRPHLVLEQAAQPAHIWRSERWDSFTLVTPNWSIQMPGASYDGDAPDAFMSRDEIVAHLDQYVGRFRPPVRCGVRVTTVEAAEDGRGGRYRLRAETADGESLTFTAKNVVVATGFDQRPKIPNYAAALPPGILQLHSSAYRNPSALPEGAVLVVGSAQSGCQIAEELYQSGRLVYLCVSGAGRAPRRYRGEDIVKWLVRSGFFALPADQFPVPRDKFSPPHVSGARGGHTLNLHQFARDGVTLLGRLQGVHGDTLALAPDLRESLARADKFEADICEMVDGYIERTGLEAPREELPQLHDGYAAEEVTRLDLRASGVTTIIWASGYTFDFGLIRLPVLDDNGYPIQTRGATRFPGLYFVGIPFISGLKSGTFLGIGEDANWLADSIAAESSGASTSQSV